MRIVEKRPFSNISVIHGGYGMHDKNFYVERIGNRGYYYLVLGFSGRGRVVFEDGTEIAIPPGTCFISSPAGQGHLEKTDGDCVWEHLWLSLGEDSALFSDSSFDWKSFPADTEAIRQLVRNLLFEDSLNDARSYEALECYEDLIIINLRRMLEAEDDPGTRYYRKRMARLWNLVASSLGGRNWTVEDLAGEMHYSRSHFTRICKRLYSLPPGKKIREIKMESARQLLLKSDFSIGRIAESSGYNDTAAFSSAFSAYYGTSPSETRRAQSKRRGDRKPNTSRRSDMKKIAIIGSFAVDLMAMTPHLPVPGETVLGASFRMGAGGKGFNQAIAAKRAGADPCFSTLLGRDWFSSICLDMLKEEGISSEHVFMSDALGTAVALISVDQNTKQNEIVIVPGALSSFGGHEVNSLLPYVASSDFLLMQLEMNKETTQKMIRIADGQGVKVILNPAPASPLPDEIYSHLWCVTPNEVEAELLSGTDPLDNPRKAAEYFLERGVGNIVFTLGGRGAYFFDGKTERVYSNWDVKVVDTTGAGDAFNGGLLAALAKGMELTDACLYANAVSNLAVTGIGTSSAMPYEKDIDEFIRKQGIVFAGR